MAELRKQALLASGVQIEGLQQAPGAAPPSAKKVVYGNRKKKGPSAKEASPASESRPRSPEPEEKAAPSPPPTVEGPSVGDAKSDWEASSDEGEAQPQVAPASVKDDWDASSEEEKVSGKPLSSHDS